MTERKLILYIAMSLDGYIATPEGELDFLSVVEKEGEDYGYTAFVETIDTVIMGRKTYEKVLSLGVALPHADKTLYIITRTQKHGFENVIFFSGEIKTLLEEIRKKDGKHIYCDGGAEIVDILLKENLIDEIVVSVIPVLLGSGIPLFRQGRNTQNLSLIESKSFEKGLVQLHYRAGK